MQETTGGMNPPETDRIRFLTTSIECGRDEARATLRLDDRHQGWLGVPHGGVLISLALELAHHGMDRSLFSARGFPVRTSFRWGGPPLSLGKEVQLTAARQGEEIRVAVTTEAEETPSFSGVLRSAAPADEIENDQIDRLAQAMEAIGRETKDNVLPLPYAAHCFVCGSERQHPGLTRKFHCLDEEGVQVVFTTIGLDPEDRKQVCRFRLEETLIHPGVLAAILDETMGWGGFVRSRQGGMTVKLDIDFLRPAEEGEKMLCYGICSGMRGKSASRMFWFSEGGILPMGEEDLPPIIRASGQWLAMPDLTEEMKKHLRPAEWLDRWFGSDEA